jgi:hypothetical protein
MELMEEGRAFRTIKADGGDGLERTVTLAKFRQNRSSDRKEG